VAPVVRAAIGSGAADRWFFLRYGDPHHHLRIRFHGDPDRLRDQVGRLLYEAVAPLLADGRVWRMTYDTYQPEIERYGGPEGIELCEAIFSADSDAVLGIVERLEGDAGLTARWQLSLAGIDRLLGDFGLPLEARREWARRRRDAYLAEFAGGPALIRGLGERWRRHGRELLTLMAWSGQPEHPLAPGLAALERRSEAIASAAAELRAKADEGMLDTPLNDVIASLAHMHAIRLLRSAPRAQELVLYELVFRVYTAQLARSRR
jgi:thiopeptide-type bacteriocin biosynthesis protein